MLVRIPPHIRVRELSGRLRQAGLEIVITNGGLELRCQPQRARLAVRRSQQGQQLTGGVL